MDKGIGVYEVHTTRAQEGVGEPSLGRELQGQGISEIYIHYGTMVYGINA